MAGAADIPPEPFDQTITEYAPGARSPQESVPQSREELLRLQEIALTREVAAAKTILTLQVTAVAGVVADRLIVPITDHPETQYFALRVQHNPTDDSAAVARVIYNQMDGRKAQLVANTLANGMIFLPGYIDDFPIARRRNQPIVIDFQAEVGTVNLIISIWDMRRAVDFPQGGLRNTGG